MATTEALASAFRCELACVTLPPPFDRSEKGVTYCIERGKWEACAEIGALAVEPLIRALSSNEADCRAGAAGALASPNGSVRARDVRRAKGGR